MTWKQVRGNWVLSREGMPIGRVQDMVVHPETGDVPALWVRSAEGTRLLSLTEIQRWSREEIWVESLADLISAEEFPRLQEVLKREVKIIQAPVFEQREVPQRIGVCQDFAFDTLSPKLVSVEVVSGWLFWKKERIIHRRQILEIKENGIFVLPPVLTDMVEKTSSADILSNPLPKPEVSQMILEK